MLMSETITETEREDDASGMIDAQSRQSFAALRAEVARLTEELTAERERARRAARKRQLQGASTRRARARARSRVAAKFASLTAEVERLKEREKEAAALFRSSDRWRPDKVGAYYDAIDAWLAGCKS